MLIILCSVVVPELECLRLFMVLLSPSRLGSQYSIKNALLGPFRLVSQYSTEIDYGLSF
jgi:hypothetical protein